MKDRKGTNYKGRCCPKCYSPNIELTLNGEGGAKTNCNECSWEFKHKWEN